MILRKPVAGLSVLALSRFVTRAGRAARLRGAVNVMVTTSHELRALNRRFRKKDKTTDVLSFPPMLDSQEFAGDIAISADIAARNAKQLGHAPAAEIKILALHGMLHLAGHDHETDSGEMARMEHRLRKQLGLPVALIERTRQESSAPKRKVRTARGRKP